VVLVLGLLVVLVLDIVLLSLMKTIPVRWG
jgi:hypothetical protein